MTPSLEADTVAPVVANQVEKATISNGVDKHEEHQYLDLIREILETGEHRPDR